MKESNHLRGEEKRCKNEKNNNDDVVVGREGGNLKDLMNLFMQLLLGNSYFKWFHLRNQISDSSNYHSKDNLANFIHNPI